ncbi:MAG: YgfZ/GcvT domain-containing protein, partial [Acidimicrobiales bacterium]
MNPPGTISPVGAWLDQDFISVAGPEAESFLHGQVSQDIQALAPMAGALSLVLSPQGKVDAIVRVIRVDVEQFVILVDQPFGQAVIERLSRFRLRTKVTIEPLSQWRALAVRGPLVDQEPGSDRWAQRLGAQLVVSDSWGGSIGIIAVGPALDVGSELEILTRQVWEHLRIEGGRVRFGIDVLPGAIPAETGLLERAVSFTKGCYTGQELVARMDSRGNRTPRRLCRFVASAEAGEREGFVGGHGL